MPATALKSALKSMRPAFLLLTPVCVLLGFASAFAAQATLNPLRAALVMVGALAAHISVNALNEYFDFRSGLDLHTEKTPFSGGSGALPAQPEAAPLVLAVGVVALAVASLLGLYLVSQGGLPILTLGLVGVLLIVSYTQWLNRFPLLCLVSPGLGFGVVMVVGTHVVMAGSWSALAWCLSLVPFFLVNNLLLLNQYPDIEADARAGRNHFPIAFGVSASSVVYGLSAGAAAAVIIGLVAAGQVPLPGLTALLPLTLSVPALIGAIRHGANIGGHVRYLAANVAAAILTPSLLAVAILSG